MSNELRIRTVVLLRTPRYHNLDRDSLQVESEYGVNVRIALVWSAVVQTSLSIALRGTKETGHLVLPEPSGDGTCDAMHTRCAPCDFPWKWHTGHDEAGKAVLRYLTGIPNHNPDVNYPSQAHQPASRLPETQHRCVGSIVGCGQRWGAALTACSFFPLG